MIRAILFWLLMALPLRAVAEPVVIFAAASLKGALDEIVAGYDGDVVVSYGGSGAMAQQIVQGAPADIFLSANVDWVEWLTGRGIGAARVDLLSNRLVRIAASDQQAAPNRSAGLALGQTTSVPVGIYARQSLEAQGRWDALAAGVIEFPSAQAVLRAVELGEVPEGIVYFTDAAQSEHVVVVEEMDPASHDPILYPALLLTPDAAGVFDYMQGPEAAEVFRARGFVVLADR